MPSSSKLLTQVRRQLRRVPVAVSAWHLLKRMALDTPYNVRRLIGRLAHPVVAHRAPLLGYYATTREFLRHGDGYCIDLKPPSCLSDKASRLGENPSETFVAVIARGRVLYDCGVVISPDHRLLGDVSWSGEHPETQPRNNSVMYKFRFPQINYLAGKLAIISSVTPDNYYHWMFDILPRFEIIQKSGLVPDTYVVNANTQFQRESLHLIGIPSDRILSPTKSTYIEADQLIVPSLPGPVYGMTPTLYACSYLRSAFLQREEKRKPRRALYITRADAKDRRVLNETEIREEVLERGFEVVSLSDVPFSEQIQLFSEARIIVGPHGAGFTNAVFCQEGSILIEFMPEGRHIECFERLARFIGLRYHSIVGTRTDPANSRNYDHAVDRAALSGLLRQFI
jgi:hypothetical protein